MTKKLDADSFARQVAAPLQPVVDFNGAAGVTQTPLPAQQQMAAPLKRALGIDQPRKTP
ncbi:hypothetical protein BjapCC829_22930 [Bradyrhizobium barranii]|uniref:Uncharacterized protein n=1 Tax=Bradyrhizobium barranii TaxID=2992140 RepID=A0ABY3QAD7_9BRAD|nr:hypothetical protein [Bradyrhizobium japonicum]UFW82847.1 hypothetical protein BjapCC829_22930 [Bradyrhizobium japonicum]